MTPSNDKWVRAFTPTPSPRLRIFCLPYAGGGTVQYRPWAAAMPPELQLCAITLPGRESRFGEPGFDRLEPLIAALAEALVPWLDCPFVLYGHSLGGLLSFELAQALRHQRGILPARLIVSGRVAPDEPLAAALHKLPDDQFIAALNRRYGGIPQVLLKEPELLALFTPVLRADLTVLETYKYQAREPLPCPITAVYGLQDRATPKDAVLGWQRHTRGGFTAHALDGEHFFIQTNQARWLELLLTELRQTS